MKFFFNANHEHLAVHGMHAMVSGRASMCWIDRRRQIPSDEALGHRSRSFVGTPTMAPSGLAHLLGSRMRCTDERLMRLHLAGRPTTRRFQRRRSAAHACLQLWTANSSRRPNKWIADFTSSDGEGWLYVSAVIDCSHAGCVGCR